MVGFGVTFGAALGILTASILTVKSTTFNLYDNILRRPSNFIKSLFEVEPRSRLIPNPRSNSINIVKKVKEPKLELGLDSQIVTPSNPECQIKKDNQKRSEELSGARTPLQNHQILKSIPKTTPQISLL